VTTSALVRRAQLGEKYAEVATMVVGHFVLNLESLGNGSKLNYLPNAKWGRVVFPMNPAIGGRPVSAFCTPQVIFDLQLMNANAWSTPVQQPLSSCRITALFLAVLMVNACGEGKPPSPDGKVKVIQQNAQERTFTEWSLEKISLEKQPSIGNVEQIRIFNDKVFVYDIGYMNIKKYSTNGKLEVVYGNGIGQGPGQFQNIFSFWVTRGGNIWIVDSQNQKISKFESSGDFENRFHPGFAPMRVAKVSGKNLVVQMFGREKLFALINRNGKVIKNFGELSGGIHTSYFDAHMFPRPGSGFVWAPVHASYLYFYNEGGEIERGLELIDRHEFPSDELDLDPRPLSGDAEPNHQTLAVSITNDRILVNTYIRKFRKTNAPANVMDRYDRKTGKYINSVRIPPRSHFVVHDDVMYGAPTDTTLKAFRINR